MMQGIFQESHFIAYFILCILEIIFEYEHEIFPTLTFFVHYD